MNNAGNNVFQLDNNSIFESFNNSLSGEAEDNWVGNVFTAGSTAQLSSITFSSGAALNSTNLPNPFITAALYSGSPATGLTLVPGSVNTVALNSLNITAGGQLVTVPFAAPQSVTSGQVFTAALLIDNVPSNVFPFEESNSGTNTNSYYDVSNPPGNANTYNLASPNGPTLNGVNYPGQSSANAAVGITMLPRERGHSHRGCDADHRQQ